MNKIIDVVNSLLLEKRDELLNYGVDEGILNKVFGSCEKVSSSSVVNDEGDPLPKKRFLKPNTTPVQQSVNIGDDNVNEYVNTSFTDYKRNWLETKDVVLVLNYSEKSHAIFGDFVKTYGKFRENYLKLQKGKISFAKALYFGSGWVIVKNAITDLKKNLKASKIEFREIEMEDFKKEMAPQSSQGHTLQKDSHSEEEKVKPQSKVEEICTTKTTSTTSKTKVKEEPPKKEVQVVLSKKDTKPIATKVSKGDEPNIIKGPLKEEITKNEWGNMAGEDTGLVFMNLPVGVKGKVKVAIGYQDPEPKKGATKLDTVKNLKTSHKEEAKLYNYKVLTDTMVDTIRLTDNDKAKVLDDILGRDSISESGEDIIDEDETEETAEDEDEGSVEDEE